MVALIMAGGTGTRFWPLSRKDKPKQFLKIAGEKSMIQLTAGRLQGALEAQDIYVVTARSQVALIKEHLPFIAVENIIIEPFGMNTAPCIGLSLAYLASRIAPTESIVVLPADHVIRDTQGFLESLTMAEQPAAEGNLVTFGIVPDYPATGYGYIEAGEQLAEGIFGVKRFKEKPDLETAKTFLQKGNFYWNSGMFYWKWQTIWQAFAEHLPQVTALLEEIRFLWAHQNAQTSLAEVYSRMPKLPIDIGIMEPAENRVVIPVDYGWSDVGSWKTLADISPTDEQGNYVGKKHLALDAKGNYIVSDKFVSLIGVENLVVIETDDALLITTKDRSEEVKKVVDTLAAEKQDNLI
ncbi:MAG: mannose-1-phosphate guanylyltransferase [Candidatus Cloacimonetes bacterium]|nr:mannose-1-phosphate guanylyltransferase [Candidatus Cloacimonadota bacterium]